MTALGVTALGVTALVDSITMQPTITDVGAPHAWPRGFRASGTTCGLKPSGRPDLSLLVTDTPDGSPAVAAAIFTKNLVQAAPVRLSRKHLAATGGGPDAAGGGRCRALIINSGCANAATGAEGDQRAARVASATAHALGCAPSDVLHNSTGVIGVQLDTDKVIAALPTLLARLVDGAVAPFATGILTTDTRIKTASVRITDQHGRAATITGVVKGAGMIHPDMATMIGVITTDAALDSATLDQLLRAAADRSFHRISIDGDTSTNDSIFALASGHAGPIDHGSIAEGFTTVALSLARQVVMDAEGYERGLEIVVTGAPSADDALQMARTVGQSLLVRTAVTGGDPNWGRILAAMGRTGVSFDPSLASVYANELPLFVKGAPANTPRATLRDAFCAAHVLLTIDLAAGTATDRFLTCGLTKRYVEFNAEYTT